MTKQTPDSVRGDLYELAREAATGNDQKIKHSLFAQYVDIFDERYGSSARADLLRKILSKLIEENESKIDELNYPNSVRALIHTEFQRIKNASSNSEDDDFDLKQHQARCDFRLACFGRVPVGVEHMESGGVPRSLCYRGGFVQFLNFLRMFRQTGGFKPFYDIHISHGIRPAGFLLLYSREAQAQVYRNVAACLQMNSQYRGLMASSWWYDPQLEQASPYLTYLREVMVQNGAFLFCYGRTSGSLNDALVNSPTRQKMYKEGKYTPASYTVVWPRDSLIAWAKDN